MLATSQRDLFTRFLPAALLALAVASAEAQDLALKIESLRCEGRTDPQAIDRDAPRLSWMILPDGQGTPPRGVVQTAWQILASSSPELLARNEGNLWDSGRVESPDSIQVPYGGTPPPPAGDCWWKVRVWARDALGRETLTPWSRPAFWRRGLAAGEKATGWIAPPAPPPENLGGVAWLLRTEFLLEKEITRAVVYYSSTGFCELFINGDRIGDGIGIPAGSVHSHRLYHLTHEVTRRVAQGRNAIGLALGQGWLEDGETPVAWLLLIADHPDGTRTAIASSKSWKAAFEPAAFWRGDPPGQGGQGAVWARVGFDDSAWKNAGVAPDPKGAILAQTIPPARAVGELPATEVAEVGAGRWRVDFGKVVQGRPRIAGAAAPGCRVVLRPTLAGRPAAGAKEGWSAELEGATIFEPRFAITRFDSVEVEGLATAPDRSAAAAIQINDDVRPASSFSCSSPELVAKFSDALSGIASGCFGMISALTDGPLPRGRLAGRAASIADDLLLLDLAILSRKWFVDILDAERPDGGLPEWAPPFGHPGEAGWEGASAVFTVPLALHVIAGEQRQFEAALARLPTLLRKYRHALRIGPDAPEDEAARRTLELAALSFALGQRAGLVKTDAIPPDVFEIFAEAKLPGEALEEAATKVFHRTLGQSPAARCIAVIGGIRPDPLHPGFKRGILAPEPPPDLEWASAGHLSPHGWFRCSWAKELAENRTVLKIRVEVPPNATALLRLPRDPAGPVTEGERPVAESLGVTQAGEQPDALLLHVGSGIYEFACRQPEQKPDANPSATPSAP